MADSFFTELKRRNVFKVGIAYLVLAWVVVQITDTAVPALHLPEWIITAVFFFGAIGFPFALFFAWAFEITADGIKKESEVSPEDSVTTHTGRKLDFVIISLLVVALGYFIYESRFESEPLESISTEGTIAEAVLSTNENKDTQGSSIAVLPFVNMSSDKEQEYFSDGISEEILNVLAKIPKLHVTSRSSAFAFKGKDINISEVAEKLGVQNILEGSVRKSGTRIRITAQLIEAQSDKHLWSETYDRELTDIFVVQDEISAAIVSALKAKLGLDVQAKLSADEAVDFTAHDEYLKGLYQFNQFSGPSLEKAIEHFDKAIEIAPNYALAWSGKSLATLFASERMFGKLPLEEALEKGREAAVKSISLNSNLAESHLALGVVEHMNENIMEARASYQMAIDINPNYVDAYAWYARTARTDIKLLEKYSRKAYLLDPYGQNSTISYLSYLNASGEIDEGIRVANRLLEISNGKSAMAYVVLSSFAFQQRNYGMSLYYVEKMRQLSPMQASALFGVAAEYRRLRFFKKASLLFKDTEFENNAFYGDYSKVGITQQLSLTRATFPRTEDDSQGQVERAEAEYLAGNYKEAIKYWELADEKTDTWYINSHQLLGNDEKALELIAVKKQKYEKDLLRIGNKDWINWTRIDIAQLEQDYETVFSLLSEEVDSLNTIPSSLYVQPYLSDKNGVLSYMKKLYEHPKWPALYQNIDSRIREERTIYIKLMAEDESFSE